MALMVDLFWPLTTHRAQLKMCRVCTICHLLCWAGRCGLSVVAAVVMLALLQLLSTEILRGCSWESEDSAPDILAALGSRLMLHWL